MVTEAQKRANEKYRKANVRQIAVRFYPADSDLYLWVKSQPNVAGYIKELARQDMRTRQINAEATKSANRA
jgi:hypothetical protein